MSNNRWKFYPWSRNAKAICERLESLIVEIRLGQDSAAHAAITASSFSTKAVVAAIEKINSM